MGAKNIRLVSKEKDSIEKEKALKNAVSQIEQSYGKGSVMKLGQREHVDIDTVPTGSLGLDIGLGLSLIHI